MILVKIADQEGLDELRETYNLTGYNSFLQTIRVVIDKLLEDEPDCECEIQFPMAFLSDSYQKNPTVFARAVQKTMHCIVKAKLLRKDKQILLHAGYVNRPRSFFGKVLNELQDPRCRAVDIKKRDMPQSFRDQPHVLKWRLTKQVGRLRLVDLGLVFRFAKLEKQPKQTKKHEVKKYEVHKYVRTTFA